MFPSKSIMISKVSLFSIKKWHQIKSWKLSFLQIGIETEFSFKNCRCFSKASHISTDVFFIPFHQRCLFFIQTNVLSEKLKCIPFLWIWKASKHLCGRDMRWEEKTLADGKRYNLCWWKSKQHLNLHKTRHRKILQWVSEKNLKGKNARLYLLQILDWHTTLTSS